MAIVRYDYTAKVANFGRLTLTVPGVESGDVIVIGLAITGTSHSVLDVGDSLGNTYYAASASGANAYTPSPGTQTGPCSVALFATISQASGSNTITAQLGATDLPSDFLLYVGLFTSDVGGTLTFDLKSVAAGENGGVATHSVNYPYFSNPVAGVMEIGVLASGAQYSGTTTYSRPILTNLTSSAITYQSVIINQNVGTGYSSYNFGWTLPTEIESAYAFLAVYEFPPVTCRPPPAVGYSLVGASVGVGQLVTASVSGNPGSGSTDPVYALLKSVPKGSAIVVVVGKYVGDGTYSTLSVGDGTNTYSKRLSYTNGTAPNVEVEVWSALGVPEGNYTVKVTFQHLTAVSVNQEMHVHALVITPAAAAAIIAFDAVAPVNDNAISPTATNGSATVVTTDDYDFVVGCCTAFPTFTPPVFPTINVLWKTTTDSSLSAATSTQGLLVQLGSYLLSKSSVSPGSYTATQAWTPAATTSWVSGAAAFGANKDPSLPTSGPHLSSHSVRMNQLFHSTSSRRVQFG